MPTPDLHVALIASGALSCPEVVRLLGQQALRGGSLETLILEDGLLPEGTLVRVLAQATGFPPMSTAWPERADPLACPAIDEKTARRLGLCPVAREGGRVVVLVTAGTDPHALAELSCELVLELVPLVTIEARVAQAQQRIYRCPLPARDAALLARLGPTPGAPRLQQDAALLAQPMRRLSRRSTMRLFEKQALMHSQILNLVFKPS